VGQERLVGRVLGSFEKQRRGSYGKRNTHSFFSGDLKEKKEKGGKEPRPLRIEEKIGSVLNKRPNPTSALH